MNPEQRQAALVSLVMLVATIALGWMSFGEPEPIHILEPADPAAAPEAEQDVIARLWEDPLQAIHADVAKISAKSEKGDRDAVKAKHSAGVLAASIEARADPEGPMTTLKLLVVPIPGTPFPDDRETRLRMRYAVQSALAQEKYLPEDGSRLGYFSFSPASNSATSGRPELHIPYEWFVRDTASVLVLWLPEDALVRKPLAALATLRQALVPKEKREKFKLTDFLLIGPRSSDTLKAIAREGADKTISDTVTKLADVFAIFSPQATAPDFHLLGDPNAQDGRAAMAGTIQGFFSKAPGSNGTYFHNFIATDDQLMTSLVREIENRAIRPGIGGDRILVLAEADTAFGRSLPLALRAAIGPGAQPVAEGPSQSTEGAGTVEPIVLYRYLRGLDKHKGYSTAGASTSRYNPKTPEEALARTLSSSAAMATGDSQLDYIERLAEDMAHAHGNGKIKAVAVLGSDLYDKLVLLRTLRPIFRDAVFITTDLDARLWHPNVLPFTRNLVVASAYETKAGEKCADCTEKARNPEQAMVSGCTRCVDPHIPPFRDVYQVAVYRAVMAALKTDPRLAVHSPPKPGLYEIGRKGPVPLPERPASLPGYKERARAVKIQIAAATSDFLSKRERWLPCAMVTVGILLLSVIFWLCYNLSNPDKNAGEQQSEKASDAVQSHKDMDVAPRRSDLGASPSKTKARRPRARKKPRYEHLLLWVAGVTMVILPVVFLGLLALAGVSGEEVLSLNEGVSAWPTQFTRVFIACGVVYSLCWAWRKHHRMLDEVEERFDLNDADDEKADTDVAEFLFTRYRRRMKLAARCKRVGVLLTGYFLVGFGLLWLINDIPANAHVRGTWSRGIDLGILALSVFLYLVLLFYVLDTVFKTTEFFNELSRKISVWPDSLRERWADKFGVDGDPLAGYFDVDFVAKLSEGTGRLILAPIAVQLLFFFSRNAYFDNWSWPPVLLMIFIANIGIAIVAWLTLRRCARKIRADALKAIETLLGDQAWESAKSQSDSRSAGAESEPPPAGGAKATRASLRRLRKLVRAENRGAYSSVFQDPALLALTIPSGVLGIAIVLFRAVFSGGL